ncbi:short-chain dehydrogenase/reductase SDR [Streptomyces sp. NBC_01515]|uniref:short-chain dehydrogenase/reductase SDR n=1 Tax=Streptomyces sp. NBC_01515 TaxID=2903890 RepID=UPI00386D9E1B
MEPGFLRTELLVGASTTCPEPTIADYAERTRAAIAAWKSMSGRQPGDPVKRAKTLLTIAGQAEPPLRFVGGADAVESVEAKSGELVARARGLPPTRRRSDL